ncbi:hypothetical protein K2O51_31230 (plasmid) [Cupriavidus pinatubonensis]|uniref:hypothetical protein n=1 Tax=Cupriavidus pinatubonensis TaxID=248026 RepID=UPI001C73974A|nr:hypothetical protein [Cupriavidus pinatubonensis]QYY33717.1 hypothetical protein K2O51_31230 [Cupriavidus pinatubonensis]
MRVQIANPTKKMKISTISRIRHNVRRLVFVSVASLAVAGAAAHADIADQSCADLETARQTGINRETSRIDASDQKVSDSSQAAQKCMLDFGIGSGASIGAGSTIDGILNGLVKNLQSSACGALSSRSVPDITQVAKNAGTQATSAATSAVNSAATSATQTAASSTGLWDRLSSVLGL